MKKVEALGIPTDYIPLLKDGNDYLDKFGNRIENAELTSDPLPPRAYAYCSDTIYCEDFMEQIRGVDMLYHETTFMQDMIGRAQETYHTTAMQAGQLASKAKVKQLLIGHFSARYKELEPLLDECKTQFANTRLAREGEKYSV